MSCTILCKKKCKNIPMKRFFLPLIGVFCLAILDEFRDFVHLPIIISLGFFIIFWNFPKLVYSTASRPLYYEDLFIDEKQLPHHEINEELKIKFQNILEWVLIITNSLLTGALADYWLYKTFKIYTTFEIIGITGGIIKIFQIINNSICRIMLVILKRKIQEANDEIETREKNTIKNIIFLKEKKNKKNRIRTYSI